ncbi:MAG TPA: CBS domain-containing protein [Saprospiraceae bacterium]|nr:CBS domain-containing protein [Saprospiraceae bacterium]
MTARSIIALDIPSLSVEQTGRDAFHLLSDFHVKHLPVVDDGHLVGLLSEEDIFNHKLYDPISSYDLSLMRRFAVRESEHIFEVMRVMGDNRLTVIPVIDEEGIYLGLITQNDLLRHFANMSSFSEPGAVLVLEMSRRDYSLTTIARIVEEDDVKILNALVSSTSDPDEVEITLKLNRNELGRTIASLERHGYEVKETFSELEHSDSLKERYESLMNYLNV